MTFRATYDAPRAYTPTVVVREVTFTRLARRPARRFSLGGYWLGPRLVWAH